MAWKNDSAKLQCSISLRLTNIGGYGSSISYDWQVNIKLCDVSIVVTVNIL